MSSLPLRSLCNPDPFWSVSEMTTVSATVCILSLKYGTEAVYKKEKIIVKRHYHLCHGNA